MTKLLYKELSDQVLGAAFTVHSALGPGLLESLYQKAMCIELRYRHINYECQSPYDVFYRDKCSTSLNSNNYLNKVIYWTVLCRFSCRKKDYRRTESCKDFTGTYGSTNYQLSQNIKHCYRLSNQFQQYFRCMEKILSPKALKLLVVTIIETNRNAVYYPI